MNLPAKAGLVFAALTVAACSTRPPAETERFLLRPEAPASRPAPETAPRLRLATPELAAHLGGLCFVDAEGRASTLVHVRFAAPLEELVVDAALDRLRAAGRWSAVLPPAHPGRAAETLRLRVRRCEIDASGAAYAAVVRLEGTLDRDDAREVLRVFSVEGRSAPASSAPADFVRALEAALADALDRAVAATL
jgi:uncharacterized lipoprotein YmbA